MAALGADLRYAFRALAKNPAFTAVAIAILALGIGANTALYGWLRTLLLEPLPGVRRSGEIVAVETRTPAGTRIDSSWADFEDLERQAGSFSGMAAFQQRHVTLQEKGGVRRLYALFVSDGYFDTLGVTAQLGRTFSPEEAHVPGGRPVVVIGDGFWREHFHADPRAVGQSVRINDQVLTVVGVAPRAFKGTINGLNFEVYVPLAAAPLVGGEVGGSRAHLEGNRTTRWLALMGRLRPGVDGTAAQSELETIAARLASAYPDSNRGIGFVAEPVRKATYGASSRLGAVVVALFAAVGLVLLIACSNVANLLLVRASARRREVAVRLALGATRRRLVRQLVTESVLLALCGGAAGFLVVPYVNSLMGTLVPPGVPLPIDLDAPMDAGLFAFGFALSIATGVLFGLIPAIQASRPDMQRELQEGAAGAGGGRQRALLRRALVVGQLGLALLLLSATGLFLKSLRNASRIDPGFDASGVLLVGFDFPASIDRTSAVPFYRRLLDRVSEIPGVAAASYGNHPPLWIEGGDWEDVRVDGYTPAPNENMKIDVTLTWPGYFGLMRMPLVSGRDFSDHDVTGSGRVAVVNQAFADRYFADRTALGSRIWIGDDETTIVGVARTAKYRSLVEPPRPFVYLPQLQTLPSGTALHVRLRPEGESGAVLARIQSAVHAIDPRVATVSASLSDATETAVLPQRLGARLLGSLAVLALAISAIGIYGVIAYSVSLRRREIGIRVALGARPAEVRSLVLREGAALVGAGVALGLAASAAATRLLSGLLIGVSPNDPAVMAAVAVLLGGTALLASWLPARRAARLDPNRALRSE